MEKETNKISSKRYAYLVLGIVVMLFAGIIYAWSILKAPLQSELSFSSAQLALNFTLTMCCFCIGGFLGSKLSARLGMRVSIIISALSSSLGFVLTAWLLQSNVILLYVFYAVMAGLGIGISYNVIITSVSAWFPDKKGLCSGCLMMGFGSSSLVLGNLASSLFTTALGWRNTYMFLGAMLGIMLIIAAFVLKKPTEKDCLPKPQPKPQKLAESFERRDFTSIQMIKRFSFWRAFLSLVCLTAVGSAVISFARDLALSVGAEAFLATTLVGILAVFNGLGRILTGAMFDKLGRKITMLSANIMTMLAAGITLISVYFSSLPLCIFGLCLTGLSYGTSPTVSSAFTSAFYGDRYFASNFSIMNFNLMFASFVATVCGTMLEKFGSYTAPFVLLLVLSLISLLLCISIKKP